MSGRIETGPIAAGVGSPIATGDTHVAWLVTEGASFSLAACPRDLVGCTTPAAILPPRAGTPTALAAGAGRFFVAGLAGDVTELVRVRATGGPADVMTTSKGPVLALAASADWLYFVDPGAGAVARCPLEGACAPEIVGTVKGSVRFLAVTARDDRLFLLADDGLYSVVLPGR